MEEPDESNSAPSGAGIKGAIGGNHCKVKDLHIDAAAVYLDRKRLWDFILKPDKQELGADELCDTERRNLKSRSTLLLGGLQ